MVDTGWAGLDGFGWLVWFGLGCVERPYHKIWLLVRGGGMVNNCFSES